MSIVRNNVTRRRPRPTAAVAAAVALAAVVVVAGLLTGGACSRDPAAAAAATQPTPTTRPADGLPLDARLRHHVEQLAGAPVGVRNHGRPEAYAKAGAYLRDALFHAGYDQVVEQTYEVNGAPAVNYVVEIRGAAAPDEVVVVGAHYDSVANSPGANDNASGVAATLELARRFRADVEAPRRSIRFAFFANEEPPNFQRQTMGSLVYARACHERGDGIVAMISMETIGYYSDAPGSQKYPPPLDKEYPDVGNFVGFVTNLEPQNKALLAKAVETFKASAKLPVESAALPPLLPGVSWSDHYSFWQFRYPAMMVTDTAPFRYPHYHKKEDTPDKLDYAKMAALTDGIAAVVRRLADE